MKSMVHHPSSGLYSEDQILSFGRRLTLPDLTLPFWGYRKKVPAYRIMRLEGVGNYTKLYFCDGTSLVVSLTLKKMEGRLSPEIFVRPHKKNIINLLYLNEVRMDKCLTVRLTNGDEVEVSRRKTTSFLKQVRLFQKEFAAPSELVEA